MTKRGKGFFPLDVCLLYSFLPLLRVKYPQSAYIKRGGIKEERENCLRGLFSFPRGQISPSNILLFLGVWALFFVVGILLFLFWTSLSVEPQIFYNETGGIYEFNSSGTDLLWD